MTGRLRESVAFDEPTPDQDVYGGTDTGWTERHACRAEFMYKSGNEAGQGGGREALSRYKVKIRSTKTARTITEEFRMRDTRRNVEYNLVEVDNISDRHWIWIVAESGAAP